MTDQLLKKTAMPVDSRFGKRPEERNIEEALRSGVVVIDKPMGPTSHQVSAWVRDMLGIDKAGHGGTLDPRVTGVLPIGLGNAVRAMDYIHSAGKRYVGLMRLHGDVSEGEIAAVAKEFTSEIFQTPPVRSAVKREIRTRRIHSLTLLESSGRDTLFEVSCEGGTYIRSLCVDMGDALGVGAHLQDLRRTVAGPFAEPDLVTLHHLRDSVEFSKEGRPRDLLSAILPMERIFSGWRRIVIKDSAVDAVCHGAPVAIPGVLELSRDIKRSDRVAVFTLKGEVVATAVSKMGSEEIISSKDGLVADLERVFMEPSTYPKTWTSRGK